MPGIGGQTAARILLEVGDASNFASAAHLAAYAGIAPVTRTSGTSIRGEHPPAPATANSVSSSSPRSPPCPTRSVAPTTTGREPRERKHNAALICLARRRCDVLSAMLRNKTYYQPATA
jgi:hypothetical protein